MFDIIFYRIDLPNNKLDKSNQINDSHKVKKVEGTLRNDTSILSPIILIKAEQWGNTDNPSNCNYAYIPKFNRYYWVDLQNTKTIRNGLWSVVLYVDPLMSWKKDILNSKAIIIKQQDDINKDTLAKTDLTDKMIVDGTYKAGVDTYTKVIDFENGEDTELIKAGSEHSYILTVLGNTIDPT